MSSNIFNADEIFEMAEEIERNGAKFYRRAAELFTQPERHKLFLDLAQMEDTHEQTFAHMREEMRRSGGATTIDPVSDPSGEAGLYLQALASGYVFDANADPTESMTGDESIEDILRLAIGREKDSIVFFLGMKDLVSEKLGKDRIDGIIREEMNHITILSKKISEPVQ